MPDTLANTACERVLPLFGDGEDFVNSNFCNDAEGAHDGAEPDEEALPLTSEEGHSDKEPILGLS